jgi:hypothetical protein
MTNVHTEKELTPKQLQVIAAVLESKNYSDACKKCGISARLFYKWQNEKPAFKTELNRCTAEITSMAIDRLKILLEKSVDVLGSCLDDTDARVKIQAAKSLIDFYLKSKELLEFDERLEVLEKQSIKIGDKTIEF